MGNLNDRFAIVTGACSGLGLATAIELEKRGAHVLATDLAPRSDDLTPSIDYVQMDVSDPKQWDSLADQIKASGRRLDILVNNAGIATYHAVTELEEEDWDRVINVNQKGVWLGMKMAIPLMLDAGGGSIINMSSILGPAARPGIHSYHAAKGAVLSMTRNAAVTYAANDIRVNSVVPGFISTPATNAQDPDINKAYIAATPMGRPGEPQDIAQAVAFLASDESTFITGTTLVVDGGYLAQ
ncbi:SDR family NAD(P)-dependent oxidoreductase [Paenarthrobacter sp. NPDC058040]|uniref:SDR family NAD(P)-dependent oxidoreductase n=1 Tax=unclassified Paenarthrobacter TaxID=2634190 RepID=UPI0036DF43C1